MSTPGHRRGPSTALLSGAAVFACLALSHVAGLTLGLAYLAPAIFVFVLLSLGRYPGERLLLVCSRRARPRRSTSAFVLRRRAVAHLPRGGSLLASSLAGRAPPLSPGWSDTSLINSGGTQNMKAKSVAVLLAAGALLAPACAQAHISLHPNTVPAGAFATLDVRVPGEQEGAYVEKVDVLFPPGFTGVDYEDVPGWGTKVIETKLATPIEKDGETIDSDVSQIVWTWTGPLGKVENGQFIQFPLSLAIPAEAAGRALEFRTVQTYSNGQVVHWISPSLEAEHPSPRINVTARGGAIQDIAGDEAGPVAGQTALRPAAPDSAPASARPTSSGASDGLAITALVIGALGLLAGLWALSASRRRAVT